MENLSHTLFYRYFHSLIAAEKNVTHSCKEDTVFISGSRALSPRFPKYCHSIFFFCKYIVTLFLYIVILFLPDRCYAPRGSSHGRNSRCKASAPLPKDTIRCSALEAAFSVQLLGLYYN